MLHSKLEPLNNICPGNVCSILSLQSQRGNIVFDHENEVTCVPTKYHWRKDDGIASAFFFFFCALWGKYWASLASESLPLRRAFREGKDTED